MCVCVCIYVYKCIYLLTYFLSNYLYVRVCVYVCVHVHTYACVSICTTDFIISIFLTAISLQARLCLKIFKKLHQTCSRMNSSPLHCSIRATVAQATPPASNVTRDLFFFSRPWCVLCNSFDQCLILKSLRTIAEGNYGVNIRYARLICVMLIL